MRNELNSIKQAPFLWFESQHLALLSKGWESAGFSCLTYLLYPQASIHASQ